MKKATPKKEIEQNLGEKNFLYAYHQVRILSKILKLEKYKFKPIGPLNSQIKDLASGYLEGLHSWYTTYNIKSIINDKRLNDLFKLRNVGTIYTDPQLLETFVNFELVMSKISSSLKKELSTIKDTQTKLLKEEKNIDKYIKAFSKECEQLEKQKIGIHLHLEGYMLCHDNLCIKLAKKEKLLIMELYSNGQLKGKDLKHIEKEASNTNSLKSSINKKVRDGLKIKEPLLPTGTYFINKIFRITT